MIRDEDMRRFHGAFVGAEVTEEGTILVHIAAPDGKGGWHRWTTAATLGHLVPVSMPEMVDRFFEATPGAIRAREEPPTEGWTLVTEDE